ncbi:unnamed protein product, partial [Brassica rapa]
LCVLNRQPTWAKITQTRAESKDQRADMCTDGQPQTSSTDVLCVLTDTHGRPVCADGHTRTSCTHTDKHRQPRMSCTFGVCWRTPTDVIQPTWAKITQTVHGMGQRAESKDQRADMCTDGQPRTSCSTGRASVLSPWTNVLICVLMDRHGRPVCADGHRRTHTDTHRQPRTSCTPTDVMCVLNRQPTWAKITRTVHGRGQPAESKDQRAEMCNDGQPRTSCVC